MIIGHVSNLKNNFLFLEIKKDVFKNNSDKNSNKFCDKG